jgi:Na+/proline symporter
LSWTGAGTVASAVGVFAAGALGNLPSQDLLQRIFSSKSERTAKAACVWAGGLYLVFGAAPVMLGLVGPRLGVGIDHTSVLPALAKVFLNPVVAAIFLLTVMSAVLSTIDSAILGPATVLSENVVARAGYLTARPLLRNRLLVLVVAAISLVLAFAGETAYSLLESAYELGLVSLLAPMTIAVYARRPHAAAAMASMLAGTLVWFAHMGLGAGGFFGTSVPLGLACFALSCAAYVVTAKLRPV